MYEQLINIKISIFLPFSIFDKFRNISKFIKTF
jgi:hypothetical protein